MKKDHYFKKMKSVDWFSWRLYQGKDVEIPMLLLMCLLVLINGGITGLGLKTNHLYFLWMLITIPLFVLILRAYFVWLDYPALKEYQMLNRSYYIQLFNDKEKRYYSDWYLANNQNLAYGDYTRSIQMYSWETEDDALVRLKRDIPYQSEILHVASGEGQCTITFRIKIDWHSDKYHSVREEDRTHWKNTIPENRVLSYWEFLKYKKKQNQLELIQKEMKNIEEFKKYYGLDVKEVDEIVK